MKFTTRQKPDGSWFADFRINGERYRPTLKALNKKQANNAALDIIIKMLDSPELQKVVKTNSKKTLTIKECLTDYLVHMKTDPEHKRRPEYIKLIETQIVKLLSGTGKPNSFRFSPDASIESITNADIIALKKSRGETLKMATISHELKLLRAALNHARFQGYQVPQIKITVPQNESRQRHFNNAEFKRLYDYLNPATHGLKPGGAQYRHWLDAYHLCLTLRLTGTRVGECSSIKFSDIDFEGQCIKVLTAKQHKPTYRFVPLPPVLAAVMRERMETARLYDPVGFMSYYVFGEGDTLKRHQCRLITRAINTLGFNKNTNENLCLHSFRHSFASENLKTGKVSLPEMQQLLGHSSINTTMIYAHHVPAESVAKVLEIPSPV